MHCREHMVKYLICLILEFDLIMTLSVLHLTMYSIGTIYLGTVRISEE